LAQIEQAQAVIDEHLAAGPDGRCLACGQQEPCAARINANATFARYGCLPRRKPGLASRGLDMGGRFDWLAGLREPADA
jgi:hypothetical protein